MTGIFFILFMIGSKRNSSRSEKPLAKCGFVTSPEVRDCGFG